MEHGVSLITTVAAAFGGALLLGFLAEMVRVPSLVGYLLAGVLIGPSTPGFGADAQIASQLSEIGVMLLMFGVGLHFSSADLLSVRRVVVPGALVQMSVTSAIGFALAHWWGWSVGGALVFGLALSCASTVVLLKALESRSLLQTLNGRIAVGWLVVQDLVTVLVLVLLPPLAEALGSTKRASGSQEAVWLAVGQTLFQVCAFIVLMWVVGRRLLPWLLWKVTKTGSRELFTLAVVASAIGIAFGASAWFGVSFALGAFIAGTVMRESEFSHRAAEETLPLRDAFSVLFFVSVGMVFDPSVLIEQPLRVLALVAIVVVGNSVLSMSLILSLRYPLNSALTVSAGLGQIGEFSIILAGVGLSIGLLPPQGVSLILAGVLISIALNSFLFSAAEPLRRWVLQRSSLARELERREDPYAELPMSTEGRYLSGQVVLVGYGRVGRRIAAALLTCRR
jgi:monovalent cation:H+ antiporter-2, CPA2 family